MSEPQQQVTEPGGNPARSSAWRKWSVRLLAVFGALSIAVIALAFFASRHKSEPAKFSADEMIDQIMLSTYGKYSESERGWMYVDEARHTYVMRVVHRAKIVDAAGNEELYFIASGDYLAQGSREPITGAFKVMADPAKSDGSLIQLSKPYMQGIGDAALSPESIRFEALSNKTFGWVLKARSNFVGQDADGTTVTNIVLAPNADTIAEVANFPAQLHVEVAHGCAAAQARYADWHQAQASGGAAAAAHAASTAASASEAEEEESDVGDEEPPLRCSDATFTYKTDTVPEDGFVSFTVTGNGPVNGETLSSKNWKLVFDHKSFTYLVPDGLRQLNTGY